LFLKTCIVCICSVVAGIKIAIVSRLTPVRSRAATRVNPE
jgi:hypothetical protein